MGTRYTLRMMITAALLFSCCFSPLTNAQELSLPTPDSKTWVMDLAALLPEAERAKIDAVSDALRTDTGTQLFVLTVPSTGAYTTVPMHLSSFANLALHKIKSTSPGAGENGDAKSMLLLISESEERGYLELLGPWDLSEHNLSRRVKDEQLDSRLRRGEFSQAVVAGVSAADRLARGMELPRKSISWLALLKTLARPMLVVALVAMLVLRHTSRLTNRFTPAKQLHGLALDGDAAGILKQLERGAQVNAKDVLGLDAIHYAAQNSYQRVMGHLLDYGADPNSPTPEGETSLFFAAKRGDAKMTETLVTRGASMDHVARDGSFPLLVAVMNSQRIVAKVLLEHGADTEQRNRSGQTSLHASVERGLIQSASLLLQYGANPNVCSLDGNTPLVTAMKKNNEEMGKLLLSNGAEVNANREHGITAIIQAVLEESVGCTQMLLEAGADPHVKVEMTKFVLDVDLENELKFTNMASALELAKSKGKTEIVEAIVSFETDAARRHTILDAVRDDDTEGLEAIIEMNPHVINLRTKTKQWTPLVAAVHGGHKEITELLLKKGANVNVRTRKGHTPLMYAAGTGEYDIAIMLIKANADVLVRLVDGKSAADLAEENGHPDLAKFLKSSEKASSRRVTIHEAVTAGDIKRVAQLLSERPNLANLHTRTHGWSPLHLAVADRNAPIVKLLLARGANVNARNKRGKTALHHAALRGNSEMLELLLQYKANVTSIYRGETPLDRALQRSHTRAADLLRRYAEA